MKRIKGEEKVSSKREILWKEKEGEEEKEKVIQVEKMQDCATRMTKDKRERQNPLLIY